MFVQPNTLPSFGLSRQCRLVVCIVVLVHFLSNGISSGEGGGAIEVSCHRVPHLLELRVLLLESMGTSKVNGGQPLLLGWDRVMEDLGKGVVGHKLMVTKEEVLKSQGKLCMDLIAEGLSFQEVGC